ncbi:MAG: cyclase family protein [Verrucomicrobiota bacterium]
MKRNSLALAAGLFSFLLAACNAPTKSPGNPRASASLWGFYESTLKDCKYVDLTHAFSPTIPVWPGFGQAQFLPAVAARDGSGFTKGQPFEYERDGFIATAYVLPTDQYGTQLDPPAHWDPHGMTISDLPATMAVRPLVVIDVHEQVARDPGYFCSVDDVKAWEAEHGRIPAGAVVMVRSDWSKRWGEGQRFAEKPFPSVSLAALKFLHEERDILFHGHEPLDTDTTPTLEGEHWLLHNGYCQAEGVANLDQVPEAGALITIGFAKPEGGTGGYARYVAICPPDWPHGQTIAEAPGAPLPERERPLRRDAQGVLVESPE